MSWGFILGDDLLIYTTAFICDRLKSLPNGLPTRLTPASNVIIDSASRAAVFWTADVTGTACLATPTNTVATVLCGVIESVVVANKCSWSYPDKMVQTEVFTDSCYCVWTLSSLITFLLFWRARKFLLNHCWRQCQVFVFSLKVEITTFNDS